MTSRFSSRTLELFIQKMVCYIGIANLIFYTEMSRDSDDEWEIVEDEIIYLFVNEEIVGTSEPQF